MTVIVLGGPPAVGHNTVAEIVATTRDRIAIVDLDDVCEMIRSPNLAPADGPEGDAIYRLSIEIGCKFAQHLDTADFDVLILDVAPPDSLDQYRAALSTTSRVVIALLSAPIETVLRKDTDRDTQHDPLDPAMVAWRQRIRMLHEQCESAHNGYDEVIDATTPAEQTAQVLAALLD